MSSSPAFRRATCFAILLCALAPAKNAEADHRLREFGIPVKQYRLKNGLRVVLSADLTAPVVAVCVAYAVGSRDEQPGQTGSAHLLEHLMFHGSANVAPGEHSYLIRNVGGFANATTNTDRTNYCEATPANQLDLALFLEADRMASLEFSAEKLTLERKVVAEERNLRITNRAYGRAAELANEMAADNFAYAHPMIGTSPDLAAATIENVERLYRRYYLPNNAVLVVAGGFRVESAVAAIAKNFGRIPPGPAPPPPDLQPRPSGPDRRATVEDPFATAPRLDVTYGTPPGNTADWYALAIAGDVIAEGQSSPLQRRLVAQDRLAVSITWEQQQRRSAALGTFRMIVKEPADLAAAEAALYEEIDRFQEQPIEPWRIEKVRRNFVLDTANRLQSNYYRAMVLSEFALFYNSPNLINGIVDRLYEVRTEDIHRVARKYWAAAGRHVVITVRKARGGEAQIPTGGQSQ
jgi:zinc protease